MNHAIVIVGADLVMFRHSRIWIKNGSRYPCYTAILRVLSSVLLHFVRQLSLHSENLVIVNIWFNFQVKSGEVVSYLGIIVTLCIRY